MNIVKTWKFCFLLCLDIVNAQVPEFQQLFAWFVMICIFRPVVWTGAWTCHLTISQILNKSTKSSKNQNKPTQLPVTTTCRKIAENAILLKSEQVWFVPIISISNPKEVPALHCNVFEALTRETLANEIHSNSKLRWDHMSGSLLTKIIVYVFFLLYFSTSSILYP